MASGQVHYWVRVCILAGTLAISVSTFAKQATDTNPTRTSRILASQVTLSNVELFKLQVIRDLPIGTAKEDVESYLTSLMVEHSFADTRSLIDQNTFYGGIENIGFRLGFPGSLAIRIHVDANDKVDKVSFRIDYLAP
jgi:hypothetical protein